MAKFSEIINKDKPVLVDFFATWCGPCQTMGPVLEQVKEALGDEVSILKIDVDKNQALASKFQVRGVPTFILFKNGQQVWKQSGIIQKRELIQVIQSA
ncbi:thioredoxin [Bizionia paragorgiae]|jgi:thioredoxin 1|uniref:Thioredoxin n=1 Tax=Bizionia paragorgiae TaxID=283786 RepID=A0A1H3XMB0_BIZPA|nr:thioredoxin [Bizionia paragorgiae]MDX1270521.1 thioredoxin [Bizionia paragorgiae]SEA00509.1 thioredoxin [Bizionia paragorgiae]